MNNTVRFGDLPVGAKFRVESMWCEKVEPRVCQQSRDFYAGKVPGYPFASEFHDWNATAKFLNHGESSEMSFPPDRLVTPL